jgi:hypothetical protein
MKTTYSLNTYTYNQECTVNFNFNFHLSIKSRKIFCNKAFLINCDRLVFQNLFLLNIFIVKSYRYILFAATSFINTSLIPLG